MATVDRPPAVPVRTTSKSEDKTIFNLLSNLKSRPEVVNVKSGQIDSDDIVIVRSDPITNQSVINKTAYQKLHTSSLPPGSTSIDKVKERFEERTKADNLEVNSGKESSIPIPRVRRTRVTRSQVIIPTKRTPKTLRFSLDLENGNKDVNANHLRKSENVSSDDEEYVTIVRRSASEESIAKIEKELSAFTFDPDMEKKKKNSFRKIFSVFSKKKIVDDKSKSQNKDNAGMYSENYQNESNTFNRNTPYRHTTGGDNYSKKPAVTVRRSDSNVKDPNPYLDKKIEEDYAQKHIEKFNKFKENFENVNSLNNNPGSDRYNTSMDKPIIKNPPVGTYMNMPGIRKYIDTSSSESTLESDRSNIYQTESAAQASPEHKEKIDDRTYGNSMTRVKDTQRDTPPRLLETKQDLRLVNPKAALIPINSERALPNPYQHTHSISLKEIPKVTINDSNSYRNTSLHTELSLNRPNLSETYGTVLDSLENRPSYINTNRISPKGQEKVPRSPSLEPSKLKLPPNREIIPLSPRVRSPIPPDNAATEKIIATELLKTRRSPTPTKKGNKEVAPSHQRFDNDIDYPEFNQNVSRDSLLTSADNISSKPPPGNYRQPNRLPVENGRMEYENRLSQASPITSDNMNRLSRASPIGSADRIVTNAQVHINSPVNRTPTPNNSTQSLSLTPVRSSNGTGRPLTPSEMRVPDSPRTPQKEDMRKSVEAYYWKEIKKLKDQENYDLYLLQMYYGNMNPYGYTDDQASVRRSRSLSPSANRNSRRSLSLPRDVKGTVNAVPDKRYYPNAIPENQAVNHQNHPRSVQQLQFQQQNQQNYFNRNVPERRTVDSNPKNFESTTNSLYRPIFKRGSLNMPPQQVSDDSLKRKVSFSGASEQSVQSWPTKNGFTKSPPQRRVDKLQSDEDDVFFANTPKLPTDNRFNYQTTSRIDSKDEMYYNTKQHLFRPNGDPSYVSNTNSGYLPQNQYVENPYGQKIIIPRDGLYGQPRDAIPSQTIAPRLVRHGSIQIGEELYPQRTGPRRISYQNNNIMRPSVTSTPNPNQEAQYVIRAPSQGPLRREIILKDEIFGQFGGYIPTQEQRQAQPQSIYSSRQSVAETQPRGSRQLSISNKVCDIYGQIHDVDSGRVQQTGVIMGQLQQNPGSPKVVRNSYSQLPNRENFVRNSRLTASANDMYHRNRAMFQYPQDNIYGRIESQVNGNEVFNRPLPPVPQVRKGYQRNPITSDTESISEASEPARFVRTYTPKSRVVYSK